MTEEKAKPKKDEVKAFELVEYPIQHEILIRDNSAGRLLSDKEALAQILNDIAAIKKSVAG